MHRSSPSIAGLAAALAKAQAELVNPKKIPDSDHPFGRTGQDGADLLLCLVIERPRHCAQDFGPA